MTEKQEINRAVGKEVFGIESFTRYDEGDLWYKSGGNDDIDVYTPLPDYTGEGSRALEVVEELRGKGPHKNWRWIIKDDVFWITRVTNGKTAIASCCHKDLKMAICITALRAIRSLKENDRNDI